MHISMEECSISATNINNPPLTIRERKFHAFLNPIILMMQMHIWLGTSHFTSLTWSISPRPCLSASQCCIQEAKRQNQRKHAISKSPWRLKLRWCWVCPLRYVKLMDESLLNPIRKHVYQLIWFSSNHLIFSLLQARTTIICSKSTHEPILLSKKTKTCLLL